MSLQSSNAQLRDTTLLIDETVLYFSYDGIDIRPSEKKKLYQLSIDSVFRVMITGHTDGDGSDAYNDVLGKQRAENVRQFLLDSLQLDNIHIDWDSKGESEPIASNNSAIGKAHNRRVNVAVYWDVAVRYFSGYCTSDSVQLDKGLVMLQSRYYQDSFVIKDGKFFGFAPEGHFVKLNVGAPNHFYRDTIVRITSRLNRNPIKLTLPYLKTGERFALPNFHFVGDQTTLLERSRSGLDALQYTMLNSQVCIVIEGHVNAPSRGPMPRGTRQWELAVNRSKMIYNYLVEVGVDSLRMNPIGYSNFYMKYPDRPSKEQQQHNRRVEIYIKECEDLFDYTQDNVVVPEVLGGQIRLHDNQQ